MLDCVAALVTALVLSFAAPAAAQNFPQLTGRVVDQANLLSPEQELALTGKSEALEAQTGRQFVVVTVNSLEGREIEDYGVGLGRHWAIGREQEDDGIILLVAPNEKKVRIETGYGAEGFLPDILAGRIIRNDILPRFREGDMAGGIMAGADAVVRHMSLPPEEAQARAAEARQEQAAQEQAPNFVPLIFWGMMILFVLLSMGRRAAGRRYHGRGKGRRRRRGFGSGDAAVILWGLSELAAASSKKRGGWGGGGGFGGFGGGGGFGGFGGGGGSFGGGGASGGW